jgi:hypothetical protein
LWRVTGSVPAPRLRAWLLAIALSGRIVSWWRHPAENPFSIPTCTISFLGSPEASRNPHGWRFYQAGMIALLTLPFSLMAERDR